MQIKPISALLLALPLFAVVACGTPNPEPLKGESPSQQRAEMTKKLQEVQAKEKGQAVPAN